MGPQRDPSRHRRGNGPREGKKLAPGHPARPGRARARSQISRLSPQDLPQHATSSTSDTARWAAVTREPWSPPNGPHLPSPPHTPHRDTFCLSATLCARVSRNIKEAGILRQGDRRFTRTFKIICADCDLVSQIKGDL